MGGGKGQIVLPKGCGVPGLRELEKKINEIGYSPTLAWATEEPTVPLNLLRDGAVWIVASGIMGWLFLLGWLKRMLSVPFW